MKTSAFVLLPCVNTSECARCKRKRLRCALQNDQRYLCCWCISSLCENHDYDSCQECEGPTGFLCSACSYRVCGSCARDDARVTEHLDIGRVCSNCGDHVCSQCIRFCFDCYYEDHDSVTPECTRCNTTVSKAACGDNWFTCGKHASETANFCPNCVRFADVSHELKRQKRARGEAEDGESK